MENKFNVNSKKLDQDWVDLILAAFDMGMNIQEIKDYISKHKTKA